LHDEQRSTSFDQMFDGFKLAGAEVGWLIAD
jgi:hypothetical protein